MSDVRAIKDKAAQLFTKGKFAKAAETYEEYCAADRKDHQSRLRCGDAWSKAGKKDKAIVSYSLAAEGFAKDGFLPRAIAASKLVLELDPSHKGVQKMLADLYAQKSGRPAGGGGRGAAAAAAPAGAEMEVTRNVESPVVQGSSFSNRKDAIDLDAPVKKPAGPGAGRPAKPPSEAPSPMNRADALELPDYEIPMDDGPSMVGGISTGKGPSPSRRADAIELEEAPVAAEKNSQPLKETAIEIELTAGQPVTGEVEIPIEGQPLPDVDQLPAELQVPRPEERVGPPRPVDPATFELDVSPPQPSAPAYELTEVAAPPPPPAPPPAVEVTLDLTQVVPEPPPAPPAPKQGSGVYELTDAVPEPPPPPPAPQPPAPPAQVVYELEDVEEAPAAAAPPPPPAQVVYELEDVEEAPAAAAPAPAPAPPPAPPPRAAPATSALPPSVDDAPAPPSIAPLPPGLKPRRTDGPPPAPAGIPTSSPSSSRIWIPPAFTPPEASGASRAASAPAPVTAATPAAGPYAPPEPSTDLERSLQAFMQFDPDAPAPPPAAAPPPPPPAAPAAPAARASFTELDLEGDSLLHAVEAAAFSSSPSVQITAEEAMEAPDDGKAEPGGLPKIPLFSDLPEDAFIALFEKCPLQRFDEGQLVFEQGDKADAFFVICAGTARVFRVDDGVRKDIATLEEGSFFGEMALLSDAPRSASVEAGAEDTQVLAISAEVLTELSAAHPAVATALKKFCRQRMLTNLMNSARIFAPFNRSDRRSLVQKFRARDVSRGDVLVKEGQASDGLYVVLSGEVEIEMKGRKVAALKEGQVFGEMSLLTRSPATATVRAARHTSLLRLPKQDFDTLILSHPQVLEHVAELIDERTRANASQQMV